MGNTDKKNTDNSALEKKQILLRLSPSLHSDLAKWAEDDFRSINGQIEYLLSVPFLFLTASERRYSI